MVLLHCFAGCEKNDVLAALGLRWSDLYDGGGARYTYTDQGGRPVRYVHRQSLADEFATVKRFRQDVRESGPATLYRLPEVLAAVRDGRPLYLVEGEKDADVLASLGHAATTAPQGASNFHLADVRPLQGADVVAIVDRDAAGARWAATVRERVGPLARTLTFKRAAVGKDAADHVAAGLDVDSLEDVAQDRDDGHTLPFTDGGAFLFDVPDTVPAIWGNDSEVLWADGEGLIIAGPSGVGKTTLAGQVLRARIGLQSEVLGYRVAPTRSRVLYLAMDRPRQAQRALARTFRGDDREVAAARLRFWKGPPPADVARNPGILVEMAQQAGADTIIVDSLKDAAIGLSEDDVGASYNRARQAALAAGIQVLELHHTVKRGPNGARPTKLEDLYGSVWITAGAGSVILLWGASGDPIVELSHLKQPAEPVGPLRVIHDHESGVSTVWQATDPLAVVTLAGATGTTAQALARAMFETDRPDRNQVEKARRKLEKLAREGLAEAAESINHAAGGKPQTVYRAITRAITRHFDGEAITHAQSNHVQGITAGQAITEAITPITLPSNHASNPLFRGGGAVAARTEQQTHLHDGDYCRGCGDNLDAAGTCRNARCKTRRLA